jgi:hypothetical protein
VIIDGVSVSLVSINVWRLAGGTLNITCNFLYCNHQVHEEVFYHPVYFSTLTRKSYDFRGEESVKLQNVFVIVFTNVSKAFLIQSIVQRDIILYYKGRDVKYPIFL